MGQGADAFGQHAAVFLYVAGADLEQVIKARRDHVALFHLWHRQHGLVEGLKRGFAGIGQLHLDKGDMGLAHADRVQEGAVAGDDAGFFQPFQPGLGGGFRKADAAGEFGGAEPAIGGQGAQDRLVKSVKGDAVDWHVKTPYCRRNVW